MKKSIEKALLEFLADIRIIGAERKKGIPLMTFVYKEDDKAVLLKALPLPVADIQPEKKIPAGKELLYRVDFFREGEAKASFGVLPARKESASFLMLLENAIKSGDRKAGYQSLCDYLKFHNALCSLEALAEGELSFSVKEEGKAGAEMKDRYFPANTAYYREILSYVQTGRDILNACPYGTPFPPFPDRSVFMAKWYKENGQGSL
ncbi:MAG: hypothetical protein K2O65_04215 [Lachnospiraceae bacterium]|nr:hypothetical protein [Lachnospiraceae bacterium]